MVYYVCMAQDNPMPKSVYTQMLKYYPPVSGTFDLHHALIERGLVRGLPLEVRQRIHHPCNLLWVRHDKHASHNGIPTKTEAYWMLCDREGRKNVDAWLTEMLASFKYPPFSLASIQGEE